ncbi:MAG TPA: hypothetical protein ENF63_01210 [Candidatus Bathyarchaeota archaeon]|nr:hypothetical protein [Candidatus Bathyarchaeota archaeon]
MSKNETRTRIWRTFLVLFAVFLIFAGPTYIVYLIQKIGVSSAYSIAFGFALLILGIAIAYRLVKSGEIR